MTIWTQAREHSDKATNKMVDGAYRNNSRRWYEAGFCEAMRIMKDEVQPPAADSEQGGKK